MIALYSGTPGSGKSYHAVVDVVRKLRRRDRNRVIANFPLAYDKAGDRFSYWDNSEICISALVEYARKYHVPRVEGQTLVVIDEAQCIFNSRDWNGKGILYPALKKRADSRMDWIKFFSQHRKFGFSVILIAQNDKMLDKQIRALVEYDVKHIKINNGFFFFLPTSFLAVQKWYGQNMKLSTEVIWYRKRVAAMYDSYAMFDTMAAEDDAQGEPRSGGSPCVDDAATSANSARPTDIAAPASELADTPRGSAQLPPDPVPQPKEAFEELAKHFGSQADVQPDEMREPMADRIKALLHRLRSVAKQACGRLATICTRLCARSKNKGE